MARNLIADPLALNWLNIRKGLFILLEIGTKLDLVVANEIVAQRLHWNVLNASHSRSVIAEKYLKGFTGAYAQLRSR